MRNERFFYLIEQPRDGNGKKLWTLGRIAEAIYSSRSHVSQVINGKSGRGAYTRKRLVKFFKLNFTCWRDILLSLGWNEQGKIVPRGSSTLERFSSVSCALDNPKPETGGSLLQERASATRKCSTEPNPGSGASPEGAAIKK